MDKGKRALANEVNNITNEYDAVRANIESLRTVRGLSTREAVARLSRGPMTSRRAAALAMIAATPRPRGTTPRGATPRGTSPRASPRRPSPRNWGAAAHVMGNPDLVELIMARLPNIDTARLGKVSRATREAMKRRKTPLVPPCLIASVPDVTTGHHSAQRPHRPGVPPLRHPRYGSTVHYVAAVPDKYMRKYPTKEALIRVLESKRVEFMVGENNVHRSFSRVLKLYNGARLLCTPDRAEQVLRWLEFMHTVIRTRHLADRAPVTMAQMVALADETDYGMLYCLLVVVKGYLTLR